MRFSRIHSFVIAIACVEATGCSKQAARIEPVELNAFSIAEAAMAQLDADKNGQLDESELSHAPSILAIRGELDKDNDGRVSGQEITDRVVLWQQSRVAIMPAKCQIFNSDGNPLAGANVTFEPEPFLGITIQPAFGVTGTDGITMMSVADEHKLNANISGLSCGLYRVKVSLKKNGKETIGKRYNSATVLGTEVSPNAVPYHVFRVGRD